MNATKHAIIIALFASMQKGNRHYTKASVDRIKELLEHFHNIRVERRWLFECLRQIEEQGLVRRKKRYHMRPDGTFVQLSSMVSFTIKGVRYMVSKRIAGAKKLLDRMLAWWSKNDGRFPKIDPEIEKFTPLNIYENRRRLRELILSI